MWNDREMAFISNKNRVINNTITVMLIISPIIWAVIMLLIQGIDFWNISIRSSQWNDELYYYKQIEAMVDYGHPKGFYGFNESHSLIGNFAAWNPTNLLLFSIVGRIFGWNDFVPIVVNISVWLIALCIFERVIRPTNVQKVLLFALIGAYSILVRYYFSVTPEAQIAALLIICATFIYEYEKTGTTKSFVVANIFMIFLVLMQGYYGALSIILLFIAWKYRDKKKLLVEVVITSISMIAFILINILFTAEYFTSIMDFAIIKSPKAAVNKLIDNILWSLDYIKEAIHGNSMRGVWYALFFLLGILLIVTLIKTGNSVYFGVLLAWLSIVCAMWMLYNAQEGSRKIMSIAFVGLTYIILAYSNKGKELLLSVLVIVFVATLSWGSKESFYTALPEENPEALEFFESEELCQALPLSDGAWNNTIAWSYNIPFNMLYGVPSGMGLNCCSEDYIVNNINNLQSKYVAVLQGGTADVLLSGLGHQVTYSFEGVNFYIIK